MSIKCVFCALRQPRRRHIASLLPTFFYIASLPFTINLARIIACWKFYICQLTQPFSFTTAAFILSKMDRVFFSSYSTVSIRVLLLLYAVYTCILAHEWVEFFFHCTTWQYRNRTHKNIIKINSTQRLEMKFLVEFLFSFSVLFIFFYFQLTLGSTEIRYENEREDALVSLLNVPASCRQSSYSNIYGRVSAFFLKRDEKTFSCSMNAKKSIFFLLQEIAVGKLRERFA